MPTDAAVPRRFSDLLSASEGGVAPRDQLQGWLLMRANAKAYPQGTVAAGLPCRVLFRAIFPTMSSYDALCREQRTSALAVLRLKQHAPLSLCHCLSRLAASSRARRMF